MSFVIDYKNIKDEESVIFLNDEGEKISSGQFEKELKTGYQAGMVIVPVKDQVQVQVAIMTPYHTDKFNMDPGFLIHQFKEYCNKENKNHWVPENEHEYFLGEIIYE